VLGVRFWVLDWRFCHRVETDSLASDEVLGLRF
jgi:hypothetical protein